MIRAAIGCALFVGAAVCGRPSPGGQIGPPVLTGKGGHIGPLLQSPKPLQTLEGHTKELLSVAWSADGKSVATGSLDGTGRVWNVADGDEKRSVDTKYAVTGVALSKDGGTLYTGDWGGQMWETASGRRLIHFEAHTGFCTCVALSPDGGRFVTGSLDGTARVHDTKAQLEIKVLQHGEQLNALAYSADGRWLLSAGDTTMKLWDTASWAEIKSIKSGMVTGAAFCLGGKRLATATGEKTVKVWDTSTWQPLRELTGHADRVNCVAASPDGKLLATGSADKTARLWDADTCKETAKIDAHTDRVNAVAFGPDGRTLATASADTTAKLWRVPAPKASP